jgi:hypothetical protein
MNRKAYRRIAMLLAATIVVLGFGLLIQTARHGGGSVGYVIGALFVALGSGRLYLLRHRG